MPKASHKKPRVPGMGIGYRVLADGAIVERATNRQAAFIFEDTRSTSMSTAVWKTADGVILGKNRKPILERGWEQELSQGSGALLPRRPISPRQ